MNSPYMLTILQICMLCETVEELNVKLNVDVISVKKCCHDNQMAVNGDKAKVILVTTHQNEAKLPVKEPTAYYDNNPLKSVDSEKLLGVKIDKHLTWKQTVCDQERFMCKQKVTEVQWGNVV